MGELRGAVLKVRRNGFHLMWFADQREDDLAFSGEVFGSAGIGEAVHELLGTARWGYPTEDSAQGVWTSPQASPLAIEARRLRALVPLRMFVET